MGHSKFRKENQQVGLQKSLNFSPASETNPPKIKLAITRRRIQPGPQFSLGKQAEKSEKIPYNRNGISARVDKRAWTCAAFSAHF